MSDTSVMSVQQAAELDHAFAKAGWTPANVKALSQEKILKEILTVLQGRADIRPGGLSINLNTPPRIPNGYTEKHHLAIGTILWDSDSVSLKICDGQMNKQGLSGKDIQKGLLGKFSLNANVLDFLLDRPYLIPEAFKGKRVYFWGTIYWNNRSHCHYVRFLEWNGDWVSRMGCIENDVWRENDVALILRE